MNNHKIELGRRGEGLANQYLAENGYQIIATNYRCTIGEIDIIAQKDRKVIFVEVRTKSSLRYGTPAESITPAKISKMKRVAEFYLKERLPLSGGPIRIRFDFIGITCERDGTHRLEHIKGIN